MINPNITINTSQSFAKYGNPGHRGTDGYLSGSSGGNGEPGENGWNGIPAQNICVDLIANDSEICNILFFF